MRKRVEKYLSIATQICYEKGYELITHVEEYTDIKMPIKFCCPKHGIQTMMLGNFLRRHECRECSYSRRGKKLRHSNDYIISMVEAINNNKLLNIDEYKDATKHNLCIKCGLCGNEFITSFASYTRFGINRCHSCSCKESSGEMRIRNILNSKNVTYIQEKRFKDCKDKKPLPFDFYLPGYNLIIEFDGQHHYFPIHGEENHRATTLHDKIKDDYCRTHGIELLRIPYWDGDNIEKIIIDKLDIIGKRYSLVS